MRSLVRTPGSLVLRRALLGIASALLLISAVPARAAVQSDRISRAIDDADRVTLPGSHSRRTAAATDAGALPPSTRIEGMSLVFARTAAQEADLQQLLANLQDASSPQFHQWLSPQQFGQRFGLSDADLAKAEAWLQSHGFEITGVSNARDRIVFSGTAAQVRDAFSSELHRYSFASGETHFAPSADLSVPAALAGVVRSVTNLSDFRPHPHVKLRPAVAASPQFTSSQSGSHFLTPKDIAAIYDVKPLYNAGLDGTGQTIAVVGQTAIVAADITNFGNAAGVAIKSPTQILVPNSGTSTVTSGDETEADLDLEYTSGVAPGANIVFVYTGNNQNYGVFDSLQYVVNNRTAPIISVSYGACELEFTPSDYTTLNGILAQAAAQGQTVIAAAGDNGSTDCYENTSLTTAQRQTVAIDFPSDSQYVTGLGGTMITSAAAASNSTYWQAASGSDVIGSALSYMPEQVWNNDTSSALSSGGGGISTLTSRPAWQTGVPGIASGSYRLTPDISLAASPDNAGYLYCSSDSKATGITGSCTNGFRDANNTYLTIAGGTSFAAPVFAGMFALLNQKLNITNGQGVINQILYTLAANSSTYATVFHDITVGGNGCISGSSICSTAGAGSYSAGPGYDTASGLGSIDLYNLLQAWPVTNAKAASTTRLSAATLTPASGANDTISITVTGSGATPTGTLSVTVDGSVVNGSLALSSGAAAYTFNSTAAGAHTITAAYSGDSTYTGSSASVTVTIPSAAPKSFSVAGTALTTAAGVTGQSTLTVTPANGYTGTVNFTVTPGTTFNNACYTLPSATVTGAANATSTLTIYTNASSCSSVPGAIALGRITPVQRASTSAPARPGLPLPVGLSLAGLVAAAGFSRRRRLAGRRLAPLMALAVMALLGFTVTGCGDHTTPNFASPPASGNAAPGTYTLTVKGTDSTTSSLSATTTLTLTIN